MALTAMEPEPPPQASELYRLHDRFLHGDEEALTRLVRYLTVQAPRVAAAHFPRTDSATMSDAVEDAIVHYVLHPRNYDPSKSALLSFIVRGAMRNVADAYRSDAKRRAREAAWIASRSQIVDGPDSSEGPSPPIFASDWVLIGSMPGDVDERQWHRICDGLAWPTDRAAGRAGVQPRQVLNAILWVLRFEGHWRDLPLCYPPYQTCHRHFMKWRRSNILGRLLHALASDLRRLYGAATRPGRNDQ